MYEVKILASPTPLKKTNSTQIVKMVANQKNTDL